MPQRDRFKAFAALIGGVVAISRSAIFVRWMQMPGVASAFYRVLFAAFVLWSFLALKPQQLPAWRRWDLLWALLGGICFAGDIGCYNVAVFEAGAGSATFLGSNAPIVVGLLTWFTTKRVPSAWFWTALAIAFTGGGMVVSIDWHPQSTSLHGDLIAVAASTCFALYLLITERLRNRFDALFLTTISANASAMALAAFACITHVPLSVPTVSAAVSLMGMGLGLVCQIGGYFSLTYALGHLPATTSSVILLAVAPLTALLAFFIFREQMKIVQLAGGVLILAAVWVASREERAYANRR